VQHLPVEVGCRDGIVVKNAEGPHARTDEVLQDGAAESSRTDDSDTRVLEFELALYVLVD
jgi:hypothetical protein